MEHLEVNDSIRSNCYNYLKKGLDHLPSATHGLLFSGTKLLASYAKPKTFDIISQDIYLMIIYFMAQFNPKVRNIEERIIPVADYTNHTIVQTRNLKAQEFPGEESPSSSNSQDEGFVSAQDEWEESSSLGSNMQDTEQLFFLMEETSTLLDSIVGQFQSLREDVEKFRSSIQNIVLFIIGELYDNLDPTTAIEVLREFEQLSTMSNITDTLPYETIRVIEILLNICGFYHEKIEGVFNPLLQEALKKFESIEETAESSTGKRLIYLAVKSNVSGSRKRKLHSHRRQQSLSQIEGIKREEWEEIDRLKLEEDLKIVSDTETSETTTTTEEPKVVKEKRPLRNFFSPVFLRIPQHTPVWMYGAELDDSVTLVILNKNSSGTEEEKESLLHIQNWLGHSIKNYLDYFVIREKTNFSVLSYLHQLPGLVHFIFVDRILNKVIAPTIGPLHGQQYEPQGDLSQQMVQLLKQKVWDMCYEAKKHLSQGYCSMLMKKGEFQYSYRMWLEDSEGQEVNLDQPVNVLTNLVNPLCYKIW